MLLISGILIDKDGNSLMIIFWCVWTLVKHHWNCWSLSHAKKPFIFFLSFTYGHWNKWRWSYQTMKNGFNSLAPGGCGGIFDALRSRQNGRHFLDDTSKIFSSVKVFVFLLKRHLNMFPRVQLAIFHHWYRKLLGAGKTTRHYLNQWWPSYIFKLITQNRCFGTLCGIALRWMPHNTTKDKSTLVQVMAWYRQSTIQYLGKFLFRSMWSRGVGREQLVN